MTTPTFVFDLDGTLAETAGDLIAALNHVTGQEGLPPTPVSAARSLLGEGGRALIVKALRGAGREVSTERLDAMFEDFLGYYNANIAVHTHLFAGVLDCLDRLAASGYALAVCTNKMEFSSKLLLDRLGVADRFAFICGQDTFGVRKPDPKPLIETIKAAGGGIPGAVMIGDSRTDIETARAARVPVVAVDFGYTDLPIETFKPDRIVSHFDEVFAAGTALLEADRTAKS